MLAAVNRLEPQGETSLGRWHPRRPQRHRRQADQQRLPRGAGTDGGDPIGYYGGTAIVLLTDGENTSGPDPRERRRPRFGRGRTIEPDRPRDPGGRCWRSTASASRRPSTRPRCKTSPTRPAGPTDEADDAASLAQVYDSIELNWTIADRPARGHLPRRRARRPAPLAGATVSVLRRGPGGLMSFAQPLPAPPRCSPSRFCSPPTCGSCAGGAGRTVRYSNVALVRVAAGRSRSLASARPDRPRPRQPGLLGVAAARPQVRADVPVSGTTIILALDVSGSMCATDVVPNRLSAAQAAVRDFVEEQPPEAKLGLVVFSGFAQLAVAPRPTGTTCSARSTAVTTGRGTTIGAAILTRSMRSPSSTRTSRRATRSGRRRRRPGRRAAPDPAPRPPPPIPPTERAVTRRFGQHRSPRSSCCSRTVRTPVASPPSRLRTRPRSAGCGSIRSASARRTRHDGLLAGAVRRL